VQTDNDGVLDPWVADWFAANPMFGTPLPDLSPELLELARSPIGAPPTREMGKVTDDVVAGVPVRIYEHDAAPTGVVVYFHGGGFCIGSIGLMDHVARELAHCSGATVVSVEYRLAPEHPYPAGLDDCEAVTRWAFANADRFGVAADRGRGRAPGDLAAAVRAPRGDDKLSPGRSCCTPLDRLSADYPSRRECDTPMLRARASPGVRDVLGSATSTTTRSWCHCAETLVGLPPAVVVLGGSTTCETRDAATQRLRDEGVPVEKLCCAGSRTVLEPQVSAAADTPSGRGCKCSRRADRTSLAAAERRS
jgi:acetyl esterase